MKKKRNFTMAVLVFIVIICSGTSQVCAKCTGWFREYQREYCATPVCHTGNRSFFVETAYSMRCSDYGDDQKYYRIEKDNRGCCQLN